ncbi:hypothetical protein AT3G31350 [Arabidopsis thaliana]|uniref:Uncharacterized protein n=1 Tax=Arabidopsis thaliana TaxID=3702 RepID=F4J917_ARATH|nr:uncharacterized protein AT3G31350 [Arabidopsis thaliana]AEE77670.1 hypothetical protein AT3G31350 [Arabidopsis thaliana]|eukprot:NP_189718.2 hypothetical protein AT3G31350 [Arabidopsis thaliana]
MAKYSLVRVDEFCDGRLQAIDKSMIPKKMISKDLSRGELICCVFGVLGFRCLSGTQMLSRLIGLIWTRNDRRSRETRVSNIGSIDPITRTIDPGFIIEDKSSARMGSIDPNSQTLKNLTRQLGIDRSHVGIGRSTSGSVDPPLDRSIQLPDDWFWYSLTGLIFYFL